MPIVSSVFLLFVGLEKGKIEVRELVSVTIKVFGTSLLSKGLYSALIVSMPTLLAAEKAVKGVAGIPAGVLKLLASVREEQLKVTRLVAGVLSVMAVAFDWRTGFATLYALKKATMDRKLEFNGFASKIALKNILECVILSAALFGLFGWGSGSIFILLQAASLVVFLK